MKVFLFVYLFLFFFYELRDYSLDFNEISLLEHFTWQKGIWRLYIWDLNIINLIILDIQFWLFYAYSEAIFFDIKINAFLGIELFELQKLNYWQNKLEWKGSTFSNNGRFYSFFFLLKINLSNVANCVYSEKDIVNSLKLWNFVIQRKLKIEHDRHWRVWVNI